MQCEGNEVILGKINTKFLSSQLRMNMMAGVGFSAINGLAAMIAYPIYLHFVGLEKYGVLLVLTSILSISQIADFGIGQAVTKLTAEESGRGNIKELERIATISFVLLLLTGGISIAVLLAFRDPIIGVFALSGQNTIMAREYFIYIVPQSLLMMVNQGLLSVIAGLGRMDISNYFQSLCKVNVVVIAYFLLVSGKGIEGILISNLISNGVMLLLAVYYIHRKIKVSFISVNITDIKRLKSVMKLGGNIFGISLMGFVLSPFNKLILSRYAGVEMLPIYEIAYNGALQIRSFFEAALRPLFPEVSRLSTMIYPQGRDSIKNANREVRKILIICGLPIYIFIIVECRVLLKLWLGGQYTPIFQPVFKAMMIGTYFSLLGVAAYYTFLGLGKTLHCLISSLIQAVSNLIIVLIIVFTSNMILPLHVGYALTIAMGLSTIYLLYQEHCYYKA